MMCMESQVCIIDSELTHSITIVCIISIFADTALQKKRDNFI